VPPLTRRSIRIGLVIFIAACALALFGLTNHPYWDDEANTALFARALRATGHLSAFDGINVIGYRLGAELDDNLRNTYMPPLQYGVAALGQAIFGDTTFGGRILFVLTGLASLWLLFLWAHWHLAGRLPAWLPMLLVAIAPAYLLYIRQCRYYSLTVLFTLALLALAAAPITRRRMLILASCLSALSMGLLMFSNYLSAVTAGALLSLLFVLQRYRTRTYATVFGVTMAAALLTGIFVLITANPFSHGVALKGSITGLARICILAWWHLTGLGSFEFFPLAVPALLGLLRWVKQLRPHRALLDEGLFICLMLLVYSSVVVIFSPQAVNDTRGLADMRYVVPLIAIGSLASALLIHAAWRFSRPVGVVVTLVFTLSTTFHLGFLGRQPIRSTIVDYVSEIARPFDTGTDRLIRYLATLPDGTRVQITPEFMAYQAMYYVPRLHYINQLSPGKHIEPRLRDSLPAHVFTRASSPDYLLVEGDIPLEEVLTKLDDHYGAGRYRFITSLPGDWRDLSRPEIPSHAFGPADPLSERGFMVIARQP